MQYEPCPAGLVALLQVLVDALSNPFESGRLRSISALFQMLPTPATFLSGACMSFADLNTGPAPSSAFIHLAVQVSMLP